MAVFVSILGVSMVLVGLAGLGRPEALIDLVTRWRGASRFWTAVLVRLVLGAGLLAAAPACRVPGVIAAFGVLTLAAAVGLLFMGRERLDAFIPWWIGRPGLVRVSAGFALACGVLLLYAGA